MKPVLARATILAAVAMVATSAMAFATSASAQDIQCNPEGTTPELIACADEDYQTADAALNSAYKRKRENLDEQGADLLRDAQRAWIEFRDAECRRRADMFRGGSIVPIIHLSCLAELTQERTRQIRLNPTTGELE